MSQASPRLRLACSRCHFYKMRCIKKPNSPQCARCVKASAECVFELSRRGCKPSSSSQQRSRQQSSRENTYLATDSVVFDPLIFEPFTGDVPNPGLSSEMSFVNIPAQNEGPVGLAEQACQFESVDDLPPSQPLATPQVDLSEINLQYDGLYQHLGDHLSMIPAFQIWNSPLIAPLTNMCSSVEHTFHLTQTLIDASQTVVCQLGDSSLPLLLSCHDRMLEIWERTLCHIRAYIDHKPTNTSVPTPAVRLGSLTLSPSATVHSYMALMGHFADQLQEKCQMLVRSLSYQADDIWTGFAASSEYSEESLYNLLPSPETAEVPLLFQSFGPDEIGSGWKDTAERSTKMTKKVEEIKALTKEIVF